MRKKGNFIIPESLPNKDDERHVYCVTSKTILDHHEDNLFCVHSTPEQIDLTPIQATDD